MGHEVEDSLTGFTGIVEAGMLKIDGNFQASVRPKMKDVGIFPEAIWIDDLTLEVLGDGVSDKLIKPEAQTIELGTECTDKISGISGVVTTELLYLNGCLHYGLEKRLSKSELKKDLIGDRLIWFSAERLEISDTKIEIKSKPVGGPSIRSSKMNLPR